VRPALDPADRLRIESAALVALQQRRGEIAVVLADACDRYATAPALLAAHAAVLALLALALLRPDAPALALLGASAAAAAAALALAALPRLRRGLLPSGVLERRVDAAAARAFAASGCAADPDDAGVLVFAARFERRVRVLAGPGIQAALDPGEGFHAAARAAAEGLASGRAADGLCGAVERCGALLARHLPDAEHKPDPARTRLWTEELLA